MNFPLPEPMLPGAALPPPQGLRASAAGGWLREWHDAQASFERPAQSPAGERPADAPQLEHCGFPAAAGPVMPAPALPPCEPAAEVQPPLRSPDVPEREPPPLRVHVQHEPAEGVRVWLGMHGGSVPSGERAAATVSGLRHALHLQGAHLAALVCNGIALYSSPSVGPAQARPGPRHSPSEKDSR